jgi:hypothetical protein
VYSDGSFEGIVHGDGGGDDDDDIFLSQFV